MMKHFSALLLVILLSTGLSAQTITKINSEEAYNLINTGKDTPECIIDGRTAAMFASGHIENAVNINAFDDNADELLVEYLTCTPVMVYCTNQRRAETIIEKLKNLGYRNEIIFMSDGINGWKANGYKTTSSKETEAVADKSAEINETSGKLSPIVQVFGTAAYHVENNHYSYGFGRAHLGFQYQFNKDWSAKIIIDRGRPTTLNNISVTDSAGNPLNLDYTVNEGSYYTMWLKFASLKWQVNDRLSLVGGALLQNHFITQERFWGLRFVSQTFQDLYWHIPSTDLGFRANFRLNDVFSFDAAITNGEGPRVKQDASGKVKYAAGLNINPGDKFSSRIYYHNRASGIEGEETEHMYSVFAGIKPLETFRIGGEFNYMQNLHNISQTDSYGGSVYAAWEFVENTEIFVRYDKLF
jgi:rhodanese-related sulfurtransferase